MRIFGSFLFSLSLVACLNGDLRFYVRFHDIDGLDSGAPALIADHQVGEVEHVTRLDDGSWKVAVRIDQSYRGQVTTSSRFTLEPDPARGDRYRLRIYPDPRGEPVKDGQVVEGSEPVSRFLRPLIQGLDKGLEDLEQQLELFNRELEQLPQSPEYQELQRRMEELGRQMREAEKTLQYQTLPKLQQEMERLQRELEKIHPDRPKEAPKSDTLSL